MRGHWASIVAVWATAAVAAVVVSLVAPADLRATALPLVLAVSVLVSFVLQLAVSERVGFVTRLTASSLGAAGAVALFGGGTLLLTA